MSNILPSQQTSIAEKQKESFYKDTYDYYISRASSLKDIDKVKTSLNAANGIIDMSTFEYIMKPLGNTKEDFGDDLPGELRNTDFITPIKEKNLGEYIELPYKFFVKVDNPDAILKRDSDLKKEVGKLMNQAFSNLLAEQQTNEGGDPNIQQKPVPDINEFSKTFIQDWLDTRAEEGQHTLNLLNDLTDFEVRRIQDFFYWWATEEFYTYRYVRNGNVFVESISPLDGFPVSNGEHFVEDYDAFVICRRISWNQFLDKYGDKISAKDRKYVEELTNSYLSTGKLTTKVSFLKSRFDSDVFGSKFGGANDDISFPLNNNDIDQYIIIWKTEIPIKILTYQNVLGEIITVEVENNYKLDTSMGDISIKTEYKQVVYKGYRFGDMDKGLYLKPEEELVQRYDKTSRTCKLPVGGKEGILNGIPKNPIPVRIVTYLAWDRFIRLQIERSIAKYKSDIWTIPKSMMNPDEAGSSKEKYFYMLADNTLLYDDTLVDLQTVVQGFRVVGNPGLERYLKVLIELRADNKREAWDLANMNEERSGSAANSQTVGNAQQNIYRAKLGSTLMITMFNKALEREHIADLEFSKVAWLDGKVGTYFDKGSNQPITVEIDGIDHLENNYGVFVRNSKAEESKFAAYQNLAFSAGQNGDMSMASEAIMAESTPELHKAIVAYDKAKKEFEQEMQNKKDASAKYMADKAAETADKQMQLTKEIADNKNDSAEEVAYIQAMGFNDETKPGNTYTDADIYAMAKNAREERKLKLQEDALAHKKVIDNKKIKQSKK